MTSAANKPDFFLNEVINNFLSLLKTIYSSRLRSSLKFYKMQILSGAEKKNEFSCVSYKKTCKTSERTIIMCFVKCR